VSRFAAIPPGTGYAYSVEYLPPDSLRFFGPVLWGGRRGLTIGPGGIVQETFRRNEPYLPAIQIFDALTERGYRVIPQVAAGDFRIDMVAEGFQDRRLAIECDGDKYHGPEKWHDEMRHQRTLERAGWQFWRCFASTYVMKRKEILDDLIRTLSENGVEPIGPNCIVKSQITEQRTINYE
jgi:hypothetical protein